MSAEPPDPEPPMLNYLLTMDLRADLDELFYEPGKLYFLGVYSLKNSIFLRTLSNLVASSTGDVSK